MSKRMISFLIVISILVAVLPTVDATAESRASNYISSYSVSLTPGNSSGKLTISYSLYASVVNATRIGVLAIYVYRTDGSIAKTIIGSTSNGMIKLSGASLVGSCSVTLSPGESYYCKATVIVENANGNDTRSYTTNTVVAPR